MSWQAVKAVLDHSRSKGSARLTLIAIAERAGAKTWISTRHPGDAFPSLTDIEVRAGLTRETVVLAIRELERLGELKVKRGGGRVSSNYTILLAEHSATLGARKRAKNEKRKRKNPGRRNVSVVPTPEVGLSDLSPRVVPTPEVEESDPNRPSYLHVTKKEASASEDAAPRAASFMGYDDDDDQRVPQVLHVSAYAARYVPRRVSPRSYVERADERLAQRDNLSA